MRLDISSGAKVLSKKKKKRKKKEKKNMIHREVDRNE
jgi:hypothetical protein